MTTTTAFPAVTLMTEADAREFRAAHDGDARALTRQTRTQLRQIASHRGLPGFGNASKDELISGLLRARYPVARLNESIHVLSHRTDRWSACEHCHPHQGSTCECPRRVAVTAADGLSGAA